MNNKFYRKDFNTLPTISNHDHIPINEFSRKRNFKMLLREEIESYNRENELASKLLSMEMSCLELTDEESNSMINYFSDDIKKIDNELLKIKRHILEIKRQLH